MKTNYCTMYIRTYNMKQLRNALLHNICVHCKNLSVSQNVLSQNRYAIFTLKLVFDRGVIWD